MCTRHTPLVAFSHDVTGEYFIIICSNLANYEIPNVMNNFFLLPLSFLRIAIVSHDAVLWPESGK